MGKAIREQVAERLKAGAATYLEPMETERVTNVLDMYKARGMNQDDAESTAVANGLLERDDTGNLRPRGWQPPKPVAKARGMEEQTEDVVRQLPKPAAPPRPKGSFQQFKQNRAIK